MNEEKILYNFVSKNDRDGVESLNYWYDQNAQNQDVNLLFLSCV